MAFLVFLLACLALSGTLPGLTNSLSATTFQEGPIQCLANQGFSHFSIRCSDVGLPVGQTFSEGLPIDILGFLLTQILGVSAHLAFIFAGMIITAVALWGATALLGRIGVGYLVGLTAASLYIVSPTLLAMTGFGSTYWAFLLIPAVAYMDLR
ncbi:MAG: hypothetical protein JWO63_2648, partial [Frankiales bacterium]|nr:hypothetical protein [Frankiales bacterium]